MEYEVSIALKAIEFLFKKLEEDGTRLLFEIQQIGSDPFKEPDFHDQGDEGKLNGILVNEYAIFYYVDHTAKRVYVVDVTYADHI